MKLPPRFPSQAKAATMPAATNTSRSPASAEPADRAATPAPRKRRDPAPRSGYGKPRWRRLRVSKPRGIVLMAGHA
jgi:hypothetical protein